LINNNENDGIKISFEENFILMVSMPKLFEKKQKPVPLYAEQTALAKYIS